MTTQATDRERAREIRITFERFIFREYDGAVIVATAEKLEALSLAAFAAVRAETVEQAARIAEKIRQCPFDSKSELEPTDPCPVCGDLGNDPSAPVTLPVGGSGNSLPHQDRRHR